MSGAIAAHGVNTETELAGPNASAHAPEETPPDPTEFPCEFGGYRLLSLLGSGGMGSVYEAEQLATGRRVALKMLGQKLDSPDMRKRFLREGRLAASVNHPNSLYVFGTDEIEGRPVISMEIASGGTLNDILKKRGPLPVTEAVDTILDVIAGLDNCFVSPDGSVKIGDFGLSVSTVATVDTFQTATGVIMGTPAYAPPEQLRGRDLDVRADIYSVGATLFTLLTNKPPIEGSNPVEVVAAALDEKPTSLTEMRRDIPPGLAKVVARCLAKKTDQRYSDYSALRNALLPFSSAQPEPAPLGRRFAAWFVDSYVFPAIFTFFLLAPILGILGLPGYVGSSTDIRDLLALRDPVYIRGWIATMLFGVLYVAVCEGLWGAGLGKALTGFRVTRPGGRPPGLGRAFVRGVLSMLSYNIGNIVAVTALMAYQYDAWKEAPEVDYLALVGLLALVSMRRRNGFATVWDLATGTRVVVKPVGAERPVIDVGEEPDVSAVEMDTIGPYSIIEEIVPGQWMAAHDPRLRRRVWLRRRSASGFAAARRDLARPGRPRWLQSVETPKATWDVFEAQPGVPLPSLIDDDGHLPWSSVRYWLYDLALELASAAQDGTLPHELSLGHVWVTAQGRAVLLDEPWPKCPSAADAIRVDELAGRQRFLHAIASLLNPIAVPLHAQPVLSGLAAGSFEKLSFVAGNLRSLLTKPVRVSRLQRAASILVNPWFFVPFAMGFFTVTAMPIAPAVMALLLGPVMLVYLAMLHLFLHVLFGFVPGQSSFGFAVISARGARAGRLRLSARWLIAWTLPLLWAVLFLWTAVHPADSQQAGSTEPTPAPGRVTAEQIVSQMDVDRDGRISRDEASEELKPHFEQIDTNKDGVIDAKEAQVMADYVNTGLMAAKILLPAGTIAFLWLIGLAVTVLRPHRGLHDQLTGCWLVPR
jgi:hypothetical protein